MKIDLGSLTPSWAEVVLLMSSTMVVMLITAAAMIALFTIRILLGSFILVTLISEDNSLLAWPRRKLLKHLRQSLVDLLCQLLRIVAYGVSRCTAPKKLLGFCVRNIHLQLTVNHSIDLS